MGPQLIPAILAGMNHPTKRKCTQIHIYTDTHPYIHTHIWITKTTYAFAYVYKMYIFTLWKWGTKKQQPALQLMLVKNNSSKWNRSNTTTTTNSKDQFDRSFNSCSQLLLRKSAKGDAYAYIHTYTVLYIFIYVHMISFALRAFMLPRQGSLLYASTMYNTGGFCLFFCFCTNFLFGALTFGRRRSRLSKWFENWTTQHEYII